MQNTGRRPAAAEMEGSTSNPPALNLSPEEVAEKAKSERAMVALVFLGLMALALVVGMVAQMVRGETIPSEMIGLASGTLGYLAGALTSGGRSS